LNLKIEKITTEIERLREKINAKQLRLRDLERQKTELENAEIIAMIRSVDIAPNEFPAFVRMFKEMQAEKNIVPNLPTASYPTTAEVTENNKKKEDDLLEN